MHNKRETYSYLSAIDTGPLLTRSQEHDLLKSIEVFQIDILAHLVKSQFTRAELKSYLLGLNSSGSAIIDISKHLDDTSSEAVQLKMLAKFNKLILNLDSDDVKGLTSALSEISFTGTIIHGVVSEVRKKYSKIVEAEESFSRIREFFNDESDDEIRRLILTEDAELRLRLKLEYYMNELRTSNKLNEWKVSIAEIDSVLDSFKNQDLVEVKKFFKDISSLEDQATVYKDRLIIKNLRLVVSRAKRFVNKGLDFDDLIQEGNLGLMKAVDKFDCSKKTKVSTYATWWIDQSIRRAISNKGKTVRVPTHIEWMETKLSQASHRLVGKLRRPPTLKEVAAEANYSLASVEDLYSRPQHEVGIDEELSLGLSLSDLLPSDPDENPSVITEDKLLKERLRSILSSLSPKSEKLIRLRFGIGEVFDNEGLTLQGVADIIGITKQGVRVRECIAFKELNKKLKREDYE